jgi:hypothetical protein
MKQTAVQWLFEQFENGDMYNVEDAQRIKHQALAMEKEQMKDILFQKILRPFKFNFEEYYNENYGK